MISLDTRNGKEIKFLGKCSELIGIDDLVAHSANDSMRVQSEKDVIEQRESLLESIENNGLREPITMYEGSNIIISGHTRVEMLRKLGVTEIPVVRLPRTANMPKDGEIDPFHPDVVHEHSISNKRVDVSIQGRYNYARILMEQEIKNFDSDAKAQGQIKTTDKATIVKISGLGVETFDKIEKLRFGYQKIEKDGSKYEVPARLDLYAELSDPSKDRTVEGQFKVQLKDFKEANNKGFFLLEEYMNDALKNLNLKKIGNAVINNVKSIKNNAVFEEYPGINWFENTDDNYISSTLHHMLCTLTCVELNNYFTMNNIHRTAIQGPKQSHYDILIMDRDKNVVNSVEIKTTNGKTEWTSNTIKKGYTLLFAYNKEMDRVFSASTYLQQTHWGGGVRGNYNLKAETIAKMDDVNYYMGDIELDNHVYRIQKYRID